MLDDILHKAKAKLLVVVDKLALLSISLVSQAVDSALTLVVPLF